MNSVAQGQKPSEGGFSHLISLSLMVQHQAVFRIAADVLLIAMGIYNPSPRPTTSRGGAEIVHANLLEHRCNGGGKYRIFTGKSTMKKAGTRFMCEKLLHASVLRYSSAGGLARRCFFAVCSFFSLSR